MVSNALGGIRFHKPTSKLHEELHASAPLEQIDDKTMEHHNEEMYCSS